MTGTALAPLEIQHAPTVSRDQVQLLKDTICKGASDNELQLFVQGIYNRLVPMPSGCFEWNGARSHGYGVVRRKARNFPVHRIMYLLHNGLIPEDCEIDHLCRNRACAEPSHLEAVSHAVNVKRGVRGQLRPACKRGHAWTDDNVYVADGKRQCRKCAMARAHARYHRGN